MANTRCFWGRYKKSRWIQLRDNIMLKGKCFLHVMNEIWVCLLPWSRVKLLPNPRFSHLDLISHSKKAYVTTLAMTLSLLPPSKCDFWTLWPISSKLKWKSMEVYQTIMFPEHHDRQLTPKFTRLLRQWRPMACATRPVWQHPAQQSHHTYSLINQTMPSPSQSLLTQER